MDKQITIPSILPGFMELLPSDQLAFNRMLDIIRNTYETFGFIPLDTPTIEKSEILLAKSGGETEKQIYRFNKGENDLSLRFDLTVPLARYVAQHFNELTFPFRRYHIGKVFRGERPQKGRFREFYQCDIDIIGNENLSIINDAEILSVIYSTFKALGFDDFTIRINNRKVLNGFFESLNTEKGTINKYEILRVVDKFDKIGETQVFKDLESLGISSEVAQTIVHFIKIKGKKSEIIEKLKELNIKNEMFLQGLDELEKVCEHIKNLGVPDKNNLIDLTIARGLDYYTGTIYETILDNYPSIGSVCSGGRYDNLAESYTEKKLPGVGISIGLSRLFYQLKEAGLLKNEIRSTPTKLLVIPMEGAVDFSLDLATNTRIAGISTEVYLNEGKMKKKMDYANKLGIPFIIVIGEDEIKSGNLKLKDMSTGIQEVMTIPEIIKKLK